MTLEIMLVAIALGADSFSVSLGLECREEDWKRTWVFTLLVGFLHVALPLLGFYLGRIAGAYLGEVAETIGAGVLIFLGIKVLAEVRKGRDIEDCLLRGWTLFLIPLSVSVDALTVGFGLGTFGVDSFALAFLFGGVALLMTRLGFFLGDRVRGLVPFSEYLAGLILVGLGIMALL